MKKKERSRRDLNPGLRLSFAKQRKGGILGRTRLREHNLESLKEVYKFFESKSAFFWEVYRN